MDLCQKIINLGLSLRTSSKMRVRQPLQSISIWENLSDYYKDIIKEELNVKEVLVVDSSTIAQKICKPNGRLIGPKFGKNVKDIMSQAKSGNFIELDEKGTEAAAATAVVVGLRSMPTPMPKPLKVEVNRPFFYGIQDAKTGNCLFLGNIQKPWKTDY